MTMRVLLRPLAAALLGFAAALLVSCGSTGKGLIPEANAGPLRGDFEAVAEAAQSGNGSCAHTEAALGKTEKDFVALPASVDAGLRGRLQQGISNLRQRALAMCAQPTLTVTTATTTQTTPSTTPTQTTPTTTAPTTTTTQPTPNQGGGTAAPGEGGGEEKPGKGKDEGEAGSGGASAGGASPGGGR
jgi:hypothetical protein